MLVAYGPLSQINWLIDSSLRDYPVGDHLTWDPVIWYLFMQIFTSAKEDM